MEAIRAMRYVDAGQVLVILSDDPGARTDIALWAHKTGDELVSIVEQGGWDEITLLKR